MAKKDLSALTRGVLLGELSENQPKEENKEATYEEPVVKYEKPEPKKTKEVSKESYEDNEESYETSRKDNQSRPYHKVFDLNDTRIRWSRRRPTNKHSGYKNKTIYFTSDELEMLEELADKYEVTSSEIIRVLVRHAKWFTNNT